MFALEIFGGPQKRFVVCASKHWPVSIARVKISGANTPSGLKYSLSTKVDLGGSKLTCPRPTLWIVDQCSLDFFRWTREESLSITYLSEFGLTRFGDIRDQCRKSCEIDTNFTESKICWGEGPRIFRLAIIKRTHIPITWQVSRRSA